MRITIHRGTDQIGGCVTEYESGGWRLFVDYGEQLPGAKKADKALEIKGLTYGDLSKSLLLITHYHGDHLGKIYELAPELRIFMGNTSKEIALLSADHQNSVSESHRRLFERLNLVKTFNPGEEFTFGPFEIMPVTLDHSAFDAYAFRISADGVKVFHTGDFRSHGFRSGKLPTVINYFIGQIDYVVCEATKANQPAKSTKSEFAIKRDFVKEFKESKYNVVYVSSTNIDRLFGIYHAAVEANRKFYVDSFQKDIMDKATVDPIWGKSPLYQYVQGKEPEELIYIEKSRKFLALDKFKYVLERYGYVLIARANTKYDRLLAQLPSTGRRVYLSIWDGYINKSEAAYNPTLAASVGTEVKLIHASGHCDMTALGELLDLLKPKAVIPMHTDSPALFAETFGDKWNVIRLNDGETYTAS